MDLDHRDSTAVCATKDVHANLNSQPAYMPLGKWTAAEAGQEAVRIVSRLKGGPHLARDTALVFILFGTGLMVQEIAHLEIGDYLNQDGSVRVQSHVRKEIAFNGRARPLLWGSARMQGAIDAYLQSRLRPGRPPSAGWAATQMPFRGHDPKSPLILSNTGLSFSGSRVRGMSELCRDVLRTGGDPGSKRTTRDARRCYARSLFALGASIEELKELLGLTQRRHITNYLGELIEAAEAEDPLQRMSRIVEMVV